MTLDDIQAYHEKTLAPEAARHGQAPPPLDEVTEQIRELLRQQRLNEEIGNWTEELRREADVANLLDREDRPLPPVVHRITKPRADSERDLKPAPNRLRPGLEQRDRRVAERPLGLRDRLLAAAEPLGHLALRESGPLPRLT